MTTVILQLEYKKVKKTKKKVGEETETYRPGSEGDDIKTSAW
jgi:hypothetical protein